MIAKEDVNECEIRNLEQRVDEMERWLDPSRFRDEQAYLEALQRAMRPAVITENGTRKLSPRWPEIQSHIQRGLDELKTTLANLKAGN